MPAMAETQRQKHSPGHDAAVQPLQLLLTVHGSPLHLKPTCLHAAPKCRQAGTVAHLCMSDDYAGRH